MWRRRVQFIVIIILKKSNKWSRWLRGELPFVLDSSFKNSGEARLCFRFLFIQCFISFSLSTHIFLCTIFDAVSSNLHKVPRINPGKPLLLELIDLVNSFRSSNDLQMSSRALFGSLTIILAVLQFWINFWAPGQSYLKWRMRFSIDRYLNLHVLQPLKSYCAGIGIEVLLFILFLVVLWLCFLWSKSWSSNKKIISFREITTIWGRC